MMLLSLNRENSNCGVLFHHTMGWRFHIFEMFLLKCFRSWSNCLFSTYWAVSGTLSVNMCTRVTFTVSIIGLCLLGIFILAKSFQVQL